MLKMRAQDKHHNAHHDPQQAAHPLPAERVASDPRCNATGLAGQRPSAGKRRSTQRSPMGHFSLSEIQPLIEQDHRWPEVGLILDRDASFDPGRLVAMRIMAVLQASRERADAA